MTGDPIDTTSTEDEHPVQDHSTTIDPTDTEHPTGEQQAAENADREPPA